MLIFVGIILGLLIFTIIIALHELGHFLPSRIFGVKVLEFGIGIPPKIKKIFTDKKGTDYTLNAIPLGGFVRILGESDIFPKIYDENKKLLSRENFVENYEALKFFYNEKGQIFGKEDKNGEIKNSREIDYLYKTLKNPTETFHKKSLGKKIIILSGGVIVNFILAFVVLFGVFLIGFRPIPSDVYKDFGEESILFPSYEKSEELGFLKVSNIRISPIPESFAEKGGVEKLDKIISVNDEKITNFEEFSKILDENKGGEINILVESFISFENCLENENCETEEKNLNIFVSEEGKIGVQVSSEFEFDENFNYDFSFSESLKNSFIETKLQIKMGFILLGDLAKNAFSKDKEIRDEALESVAGPVGVIHIMPILIELGISQILLFSAMISISLGVFNILPIPALDGGRIVFVILESIVKKLFSRKVLDKFYIFQNYIILFFFVILMILGILIAYKDTLTILG